MATKRALEGLLVLDLSHVMAGPFCAMLLGDLGADVIKVEKPTGEDSRRFGPPFVNGESVAFMGLNRNKRDICIDLKTEEGRALVRELATRADVLIENFKPSTMAKLGLAYEDLRQLNPKLIYCSISGFGQTGDYRERGGFDLIAQAASGLISVTGYPDSPPTKVGVPISDLAAGMYSAQAILAAYIHALRTGEGQQIDVSLLDSAISLTVWESAIFFATRQVSQPTGSAHRLLAPYQAFPTADKTIVIGAGNQRIWIKLCEALEREDLLTDERFTTNALRTINQAPLAEELSATLKQKCARLWLEKFHKAGVPASPVHNLAEVYEDPHLKSREMHFTFEHPTAGTIEQVGSPMKLSTTPVGFRLPPPTLGQHTKDILTWLGYSTEKIQDFRESGVVSWTEPEI
jgi:crotonobetainyl-CoA:carnitine CoA-transferase CaiB-like acyl-CoA transferase